MDDAVVIALLILGIVFFIFLLGVIAWAVRYYMGVYKDFDYHQHYNNEWNDPDV